ncbi:glycoside hydrolase [Westerdykella ornata]|uniref:Mannosyl-oligosaccharide glucosidase n=1 Tax=Westerdykella ornata TaxID=318751 RepID=A0A6A6JSY0_WESOR|nr:glycoside hydrolase [Westerdykella ornata]KAF2278089.1 glycoside hydrolase [Westerdykella ornata]
MRLPTLLFRALATLLAPRPSDALPDAIDSRNVSSLLWGPYRPNLYLGIRPRVPESVFMGLMWANFDEGHKSLRHTCEQNDGMGGYGWTAYDARKGGTQLIPDVGNKINITTEFVKISEGQSRGNWGLRVKGVPREEAGHGLKTSVVFYVSMEATEKCQVCRLEAAEGKIGPRDDEAVRKVVFWIKHPILGISEIHLPIPKHDISAIASINTTEDVLWKSKSLFVDLLKNEAHSKRGSLVLSDEPAMGNAHFVQMVFHDRFEFDILYSSQAATLEMTSLDITTEMETNRESFAERFSSIFAPQWPFLTESHLTFALNMFSNLLGGLGYFHGDMKVFESHAADYEEKEPEFWEKLAEARRREKPQTKGPFELLTHVPSRANFPRGFLWDEGFHLLPVVDWDLDLALEVLQSWLGLMDRDGWIAREQVLGPETRSKVPPDFQTQSPEVANPPTLFWVVSRYVNILSGAEQYAGHESHHLNDRESGTDLLMRLYSLLKRHYEWFRRTQRADVEAHSIPNAALGEGYRWRGRTPGYSLASGLDDYPRAEPPDVTELHVDALCWVGVMARTLAQVAEYLQNDQELSTFRRHYDGIQRNIEVLHWSDGGGLYCDTRIHDGLHTFTCPKGYISLFPFITGFIGPEHPRLNATLDLIRDPEGLWTSSGIRSLSPESTRYGEGDNYWRGPIWININYLIIEQLLHLATTPGPLRHRCRDIYKELRRNVVETVYNDWEKTGFAWEQYHPETGVGQRTQHFTGWTALVIKLMSFPDLEEEGVRHKLGALVKEAKANHGLGVGGIVACMLLILLAYMSRRKLARLRWSMVRRFER